jgi:hypothetical protein
MNRCPNCDRDEAVVVDPDGGRFCPHCGRHSYDEFPPDPSDSV